MSSAAVHRAQLEQWWNRLTEDEQERLKRAVRTYPADPSKLDLLLSTGRPADTSWALASWTSTGNPPALTIHDPLEKFIEEHLEDES
ncbi:hypothetical protein [Mycobacterium marinum]|uniref:hypothetical protein n=1 Tax=Mycobacterium marinum TaxID=1781 RepID=UPI0023593592|nr:hypothetical protein [Mycobacterium marinum]MDC8974658.1 hypothetical protein [Mycobacterium marinum]